MPKKPKRVLKSAGVQVRLLDDAEREALRGAADRDRASLLRETNTEGLAGWMRWRACLAAGIDPKVAG